MLGSPERALLERLEDESLLERVFRTRTGQAGTAASGAPSVAAAPSPRAAGLLAVLRQSPAGQEAVARARAGDPSALDALLDAPADAARSPRLLHHLALFHGSLADAAEAAPPSPGCDAPAAAFALRALDAWALLLTEQRYLSELAETVADGALSPADLSAGVEAAALERVTRLGAQLREGAPALTEAAQHALGLLREIIARAFPAEVAAEVVARIKGESERQLRSALDAALGTLTDRFAQAEVDPAGTSAERAVLADAARFYAWSGGDWYVALFALERAVPTGWSLYKTKQWDPLTALCEALRPLVDGAARRVEEDPSALPYASLVAQMLVFRAEMGRTLHTRIVDAERALRLCDTHRNARVILADLLAERAAEKLDATGMLGRDAALAAARADLTRADELWAGLPRVANLRKRIDRMSGVTR